MPGRIRRSEQPGKPCPVRTRPASDRLDAASSPTRSRRYGPNGSFWAENPRLPQRPIRTWQIWNEQNFKYFVAQPNPAEYGKLVKLSYAAIKGADPGAKLILGGLFARPNGGDLRQAKPPRAYFASDFLEQMYEDDARDQGEVQRRRPAPLHRHATSELTPDDRRSPRRPEGQPRRRQGPLDHRARLELASPPPNRRNIFAKGLGGQATQLKGAFTLLERQAGEVEAAARLLVLGRRPARHLQLLRRLRPLRQRLRPEAVLVRLREVRRRHSPAREPRRAASA